MSRTDIAIVGMAGRFPGAADVTAFFADLVAGRESIRDLSADEIRAGGLGDGTDPAYVSRVADLVDADKFDAAFFGITAQEARITDPQHRVFLECAWSALEDAGLVPSELDGRVGVWASSSLSSYLMYHLSNMSSLSGTETNYPVLIGNDKDFMAARVAYKLDLNGPAIGVQTACSSSLVGVHLAAQALRDGDCDAAIVGGVSITLPQQAGYRYKDGGIMSRDGRCRPFDAESSGTVKGNGCAVVVLKRLADAVVDRDRIYAVVRGTAVGNDGALRAGFTAPSPRGQTRTIAAALGRSGIPVADIGYVEAHGTGTALGDPIELRALTRAYDAAAATDLDRPGARGTAIGSLKANVGHLDAAAGVAGLIKAALVLRHNVIPPQINCTTLNPAIGFDPRRYHVPAQAVRPAEPLRAAAVSSFGLGGTNAHCVLEAAPAVADLHDWPAGPDHLVALSARDAAGLARTAQRLCDHLGGPDAPRLADVSYTLLRGRRRLPERLAFVARDIDEARAVLTGFVRDGVAPDPDPVAAAWLADGTVPVPPAGARTISLPGYAFSRDRHWVEREPAVRPAPPTGVEQDDAQVQTIVLAVLREHLGVDRLGPDDDFYDRGGDSMTAVEIVGELQQRFGVAVGLQQFQRLRTPDAVTAFVLDARAGFGTSPAAAVPAPRPRPRRQSAGGLADLEQLRPGDGDPVFLFPPAGGTNFCYYQLARHLGGTAPLYAMTFPVDRQEELRTVRGLALHFLSAIRALQPNGPYHFAGYSFGGNVAFEVALQLQELGQKVDEVVMFDAHPPEAYVGTRLSEADLLAAFPLLLGEVFDIQPAPGSTTPTTLDEALDMMRLPSNATEVFGEYRRFLSVWAHNHGALKHYYPDEQFNGNVLIFQAAEPENRELLDRLHIRQLDKGPWAAHVSGTLSVETVPGSHYSMFADPAHLRALANAWNPRLSPQPVE